MAMNADDILPLIAGLPLEERVRLIHMVTQLGGGNDGARYDVFPPRGDEFSTEEEPLAWEAEGWEEFD